MIDAQAFVNAQLIDAESARFQSLEKYESAICGEVNSKNRFGGYVGFRRFVVDRETGETIIDPQEYLSQQAKDMFPGTAGMVADTAAFNQLHSRKCIR